jgi:simple sugar transport system permease protein
LSAAVATAERERTVTARHVGWGAIALGVVAWYLALPPILVRSFVPSVVLGVVVIGAGAWVLGRGETRLGWGAIAAGVIGAGGAVASTQSGVGHLQDVVTWSALFAAMLRFATPLLFGALGGIVSERSGVVNIGIEGMMLMGCYFGIYGADIGGSWVIGLLVAMVAGGVLALVHAAFSVTLRADQIVGGVAINLLAVGITGYLYVDHYGDQGTPDDVSRVPDVTLPLIKDIPFVGDAIGKTNLMTWLAILLAIGLAVFLFRTPQGLRLRSVGEHPRAAETVGLSVNQNLTAGRGYIALAVVICGRWRPGGALAFACLFGFSSAVAQRLPTFSDSGAVLFQALPYVLTIIVVAGVIGRSRPPAAIGQPYTRE